MRSSGSFKVNKDAGASSALTMYRDKSTEREALFLDPRGAPSDVRRARQEQLVVAKQRQAELLTRLKKEGAVITSKSPTRSNVRSWLVARKAGAKSAMENVLGGMSKRITARSSRENAAKTREAAKRAEAAAEMMRKEAVEDKAARFGQSVQQIEVGELVDANDNIPKARKPKVKAFIMHRAKSEVDDGIQANTSTAAPQKVNDVSVGTMRRLSLATVAKIAALGAKARRRAKKRQRERAAYLAARKKKEEVLSAALQEQEAAAQIRRETLARHQPKIDKLRAKQQRQLVRASRNATRSQK